MRSLRSKFVSACALSIASVTAAVLPSRAADVPRPDGKLLHYEFQHDYAQATFSVPCSGCLGSAHDTDQDDESLVLRFTSHAQDEACGSSNITLNGVQLSQEWNGDFATGSGSYTAGGTTDATQDDLSLQRDLDLEWNSACLHGDEETDEAAQVLTVSIKAIDGKALIIPSGFTVSFKQQTSPPSLLRFESVPNRSASDKDVAQYWRNPPAHLRLVANGTLATQDSTVLEQSLENDLRELRELQAELRKLQQAIANKKDRINSQLRKEVSSLTDEINECEGLACIFKAIAHKAQGALKDAVERCKSKQINDMGRPSLDLYAPAHINAVQKSGGSIKVETINVQPYEEATDELPPRPTKTSPYIIALEVTLSLLCCGCLIATIRHKCSSLRTRTERAAAREERDTAAAYRRAARQHAWRNWWRGNWRKDQERIEDYEEKRSLIQSQESVLEDAMQAEIRQLRAAHDVVNDLVRGAEEGRAPCNCHHTYPPSLASTYPPTVMSSEAPSRPQSRTDSLPSYRSNPPSEPPNYESEVDMSDIVANGFRQYTSSTISETTSHWTPDSSVVDVSPRPSAETLRYPQSIFTCSEDEGESDVD
ncbi:hypothetical protein HBI56_140620 [Parastagonospora nodorum]|nr:hypothetical protein HBH53_117470 [Parastagonospora nodorum]KAH3971687.1 hypothetical protein HBH52_156170 [Parastagonospora nodorum]KAH3996513.1 hypothetical protein HBI10_155270 [Parastagonospora nodorum]KAH4019126.1 hypothetical protein HBI13_130800 [Parastagonospora nodorum]KAH4105019.1 hypothetical protein HBH46_090970 [Parastagonospora nodorum]